MQFANSFFDRSETRIEVETNKYKQIMDTGKHTDIHYGKNNDKRKKDENTN